jgi:hypothetical protein
MYEVSKGRKKRSGVSLIWTITSRLASPLHKNGAWNIIKWERNNELINA